MLLNDFMEEQKERRGKPCWKWKKRIAIWKRWAKELLLLAVGLAKAFEKV